LTIGKSELALFSAHTKSSPTWWRFANDW